MAGARGEVTIQTEDGEVIVLFTNRALAEAEGTLGRSIIDVAQSFAEGGVGIADVAHLLHAGMRTAQHEYGGRRVTLNSAFDVLQERGFAKVAAAVFEGVAAVLSYDGEEEQDPNS